MNSLSISHFLRLTICSYSRIHRLRIRGLQPDDYLMLLAGGLYTALVVCLNVIAGGGGSNLYLPDDFGTFTPENIQDRIKGSKIVIISEQVSTCWNVNLSKVTC